MEQNTRYNYFQQNPNGLVNGQTAFSQPVDGVPQTVHYPATSTQSQFHERKYSNPNAVPLMNHNLYQIDSSQQLPRSSGPPRTNAKGIYENSQSSIPNVMSLAQSTAENYPISPDFQLQPHLTGLLPQQPKKVVPELHSVDKFSTSRGSIAANMNTNYFSSNKSYPEPKIIEYDMEETSTESSPRHTSSLYSESTDQDSESIHQTNVFSQNPSDKNIECPVTKESKIITSSNQEFPVPCQFADLNLNDNVDDNQHSVLHSAYSQDDDIIADISLSDGIDRNEIKIDNQENSEFIFNENNIETSKAQVFDYYSQNKIVDQIENNYKSRESSSQSIYNNAINYSSYNTINSSSIQNPSHFNKRSYFSQSNTLVQPNSSNSSNSQPFQSKTLFSYNNTESLSHQQESPITQSFKEEIQSSNFNLQNKHIEPVFQDTNVPPTDSKLSSNVIYSNVLDKSISKESLSQDQILNDKNSSLGNYNNLYNPQNIQNIESNSQKNMYNLSKSPNSELSNVVQPLTVSNASSIPTQPINSTTSAVPIAHALNISSSMSETGVQNNQNTAYKPSEDQDSLYNLSNTDKISQIHSTNQNSTDVKSIELNTEFSQSSSKIIEENQKVGQSKPSDEQSVENQDNVQPLFPPPSNFIQTNNFFNSMNTSPQHDANYQQSPINQYTSQQSTFNDLKTSSDQISSNSLNSIPQSTSNQNMTAQQSVPIRSQNVSHYFDSMEKNNHAVFNQQSMDLPPHTQESNTQDTKSVISNSPHFDKPETTLKAFSDVQNTIENVSSSNQQPQSIKKKLETNVNFNMSSKETVPLISEISSQSTESISVQSNNIQVESNKHFDNTMTFNSQKPDNMLLNDTFSNINNGNPQNIQVSQTLSSTYFSKENSLDDVKSFDVFQRISSTSKSDANNSASELSESNNTYKYLTNAQKNLQPLNPIQSTAHQIVSSKNSQTVHGEKPSIQQATDQFTSQLFSNKGIQSPVLSVTNQSFPQTFSNQSKFDNTPPQSTLSSIPVQPFNQLLNTVSSMPNQFPPQISSNQPKPNDVIPSQSTSSSISIQPFNQPSSSISSIHNQLPPQSFSNQPKLDNVPPQSTLNSIPMQPLNQSSLSTASSVSSMPNQLQPQMFSDQPKPSTITPFPSLVNQNPTQSFSNKATQNTNPFGSSVSQFWPQKPSNQLKSDIITPLQSAAKMYPEQPFINPSIQNLPISSEASKLPSQIFSNQPKSDVASVNSMGQYPTQPINNQLRPNIVSSVSSATNQLLSQPNSNQSKSDIVSPLQTTSQYSTQSFKNQPMPNMITPVLSVDNQLPPQMFNNHPKSDISPLQPISSQYPSQALNNQPKPNMFPPVPSGANQFSSQIFSNQPILSNPSNKLVTSQYPSQPASNQSISGVPHIQQQTTNQCLPLNNQSKPNTFLNSQSTTNQYSSPPFSNQPGQQILPKANHQSTPNNQFYNQTNLSQSTHNQWPPQQNMSQSSQQSNTPYLSANFSNQTSSFTQPPLSSTQSISSNLSSNQTTLPPSVNQQTQMLGSHILPPNPISSNHNYYNQVQGNGNNQQFQPSAILPGQNVQPAPKGYPQQNNVGFSGQPNYQQPNVVQSQQGFYNQQQDPYRTEQNSSIVQQGFAKTWGYDNVDLLKSRDVLTSEGVQPPEIKLPQGYVNCDNCSPEIFRCTLNKFPSSKNLLDKSRLPLGILIHPYKDLSRLTVIQCETITRCRNCRSYINPFVQFIDNAHWKCNLCYRVNELPGEFQIDPYTKTLGDPSRRPEIQNATIEYIASQDYMVRPPQPALYLFLLDVSRVATLTGYLEIVCDRILNKIMSDDIPGDSRTNIGFITYDTSVHFYQIANSDGGQPKQLVVSDTFDMFLPLPDGLMVNLEENKAAIKDLLTNLPNHYRESYNTGSALGAALQAAFKILAPRGGRVTVFQASLPNSGPGSLQARDDGNPHSGDRVQHMSPSTDFYKKLALECSAEQIAVDMFFVSSQYLDIASISGISKYSAGSIHNFPQFDVKSPTIVTRFINCFDRYLSRKIGFEALLRLRCTRGVAIHSFHGNFFVRSSDLLMLPNVNPDNAYGMQLSIEDSLDGAPVVCFQAALLYTSSNAERRIRVHTLCIPVTDNLNDVFHNADQQAITCLIAKMAVDRSTEKSLLDAREAFFNAISDSLSAYKLGCASYNGPGTMLSPLSLKVFPLYILATLKHMAFRTNQPTRLDDRMFSMCQMKSLPLNNLIQYIYPDLYPIHSLEEQPKIDYEKLTEIPLPPVIQLSAERVESNGIYLMDDSETLTIFVGHRCSAQLIKKLFGYVNVDAMPELITILTEVDSKPSYLLRSFISYLQHFKPYPLPIEIIKDNGPHKLRFYSRLVEDKFESSLSYYEFLQRLSQQVR